MLPAHVPQGTGLIALLAGPARGASYFWLHSQLFFPITRCVGWIRRRGTIVVVLVAPCDPMDWSPPGSSVYGTFQARTLGWVARSNPSLLHHRQILYHWDTWRSPGVGYVASQTQKRLTRWCALFYTVGDTSCGNFFPLRQLSQHAPDTRPLKT